MAVRGSSEGLRFPGLMAPAVLATCIIWLCLPAAVWGDGAIQQWVRTYKSTEMLDETANAIALDDQGNVYVTGATATIKYSPKGRLLWARPGDGLSGTAIALDRQANVYVTGTSDGAGTGKDFLTIKYSRDGAILWESRYNGTGNGDDYAKAIALDPQGNVFVTGASYGGEGFAFDYATINYTTDGALIWEARYNGAGNGNDFARAIAVDRQGNAYVTGASHSGSSNEFYTIKYDPSGQELWARRYIGSSYSSGGAIAIVVDGQGLVYVTGNTASDTGYGTTATIKYDADGRELWVSLYSHPQSLEGAAKAMALDSQGNVFITGWCYQKPWEAALYSYLTVKYSPQGRQLWARFYDGDNMEVLAIAVDGRGNAYITGYGDYEIVTVKYSSNGRKLWAQHYGNYEFIVATAIAVDRRGNVYVTGSIDLYLEGPFFVAGYCTVKYWNYEGPRKLKP